MKHHVLTSIGHIIGQAETETEAIALCEAEGFTTTGRVDFVPHELAAEEFSFDPDGLDVFLVTCDRS